MKVLFVCMGNICRSPTAEGVFRKLIAKSGFSSHWEVDSAGTLGFHAGDPPDPRSIAHAARREIDLTMLRARKVAPEDFERFDYVVLALLRMGHGQVVRPAFRWALLRYPLGS